MTPIGFMEEASGNSSRMGASGGALVQAQPRSRPGVVAAGLRPVRFGDVRETGRRRCRCDRMTLSPIRLSHILCR